MLIQERHAAVTATSSIKTLLVTLTQSIHKPFERRRRRRQNMKKKPSLETQYVQQNTVFE